MGSVTPERDTPSCSILEYDTPATQWSESLPVGNGRLGAMVYGRTETELLQLNEDSVWYGGPQERTPSNALENLPRLRQLIRDGNHAEAEKLMRLAFFATPHSQRHYEPLGNLTLEFGHRESEIQNYRRWLDLETAITGVSYQHRGIDYSREVFASYPDNALVIQLESSELTETIIRLTRTSELEHETNEFVDSVVAKDASIVMRATPGGRDANHLYGVVSIRCECAGVVRAVGNCLVVRSRKAVIVLAAQTSFRYDDVEAVGATTYEDKTSADINQAALTNTRKALSRLDLRRRHIDDYGSLYNRLQLRLNNSSSQYGHRPTNERLNGTPDPELIALYHNYGRYLLISCSRPGLKSIPATLQGIWNPSFHPPWGSKFTININTQMNYWPANAGNLSECEEPLFNLLERVAQRGEKTARQMYGCSGWAAHHNTDIFADTDPQDRWLPATGMAQLLRSYL